MSGSNTTLSGSLLEKGRSVVVKGRDIRGRIVSIGKKRARIETELGVIEVDPRSLQLVSEKKTQPSQRKKYEQSVGFVGAGRGSYGDDFVDGADSLDLHGRTVEEALDELDAFLDRASLCGRHTVTIVHGKGTGRLRKAVWNHLTARRDIARCRYADPGSGSYGATIAEFA